MKHPQQIPLSSPFAMAPVAMALGLSLTLASGATHAQSAPERTAMLGGALPGGAIVSARSVALAPVGGGSITGAPVAADGSFRVAGLTPGAYRLAITSTTVPKQTQGATFGEKVNSGLHAAGSAIQQGAALSRHEVAKNTVGNIRAREAAPQPATSPAPPSETARINDINAGMPNRISMNVTVARQTQRLVVDESVIDVEVGADGVLSGRVDAP